MSKIAARHLIIVSVPRSDDPRIGIENGDALLFEASLLFDRRMELIDIFSLAQTLDLSLFVDFDGDYQ